MLIVSLILPSISLAIVNDANLNEISEQKYGVKINKCCELTELMVDSVCRLAEKYNQSKFIQLTLRSCYILAMFWLQQSRHCEALTYLQT